LVLIISDGGAFVGKRVLPYTRLRLTKYFSKVVKIHDEKNIISLCLEEIYYSDLVFSNNFLRKYTRLKCSKQPKIVNVSCLKTSNDIEMKYLKYCYVTLKVPFFSNKT